MSATRWLTQCEYSTSLAESDLDYYLSERTSTSGRASRGPSLFVEPYPNAITKDICKRHGLILVEATLADFLNWVSSKFGSSPTINELVIPSRKNLFTIPVDPEIQVDFFSKFELVIQASANSEGEVSPFYFGKLVRWSDLESSLDVSTKDEIVIASHARNFLNSGTNEGEVICVVSEPGYGKSTTLRRVAYDLAKEGHIIFSIKNNEPIDPDNAVLLLSKIKKPITLIIDNLALHSRQIRRILIGLANLKTKILILSAERDYKYLHVSKTLGDLSLKKIEMSPWDAELFKKLIEKLHSAALLAEKTAIHYPHQYADKLIGETIAIATCRAINNFKPFNEILTSIWNDASPDERRSYGIAALAEFCYIGGVLYPIIEKAHYNENLQKQLSQICSLPLSYSEDGEYVLPMHAIVGEKMLMKLSKEKQESLHHMFIDLAKALAPFVNRKTTISRTPEAKLAARLFNSEYVVKALIPSYSNEFYTAAQADWKWTSRYWEQRALSTQSNNIDEAIQYARHAVGLESHPFPWTTLAALLTRKMESLTSGVNSIFNEIFGLLDDVLKAEKNWGWQPTPHPYAVLFHAVDVFLGRGGVLDVKKRLVIKDKINFCLSTFTRDAILIEASNKLYARLT